MLEFVDVFFFFFSEKLSKARLAALWICQIVQRRGESLWPKGEANLLSRNYGYGMVGMTC